MSMSTADEQTFMPQFEEIACVEECANVKTDNKWEPHPTFQKEFTDQFMGEALKMVVENKSEEKQLGQKKKFVKTDEASNSEDSVMNDSAKPKREVTVKKEEITVNMSTADEQKFVLLIEEISCGAESGNVKTENKWEPHLTFQKEFTDQFMGEALKMVVENTNEEKRLEKQICPTEKPLKCLQCPKSFKQSSSLKRHLQIHTGEKPFKCLQCPKTFTLKWNIKRHLRTHTVEKPFKRLQCPKNL